jgi:hypothetical protein
MIRIFMLGGTYVETSTFGSLDSLGAAIAIAEKESRCVLVTGKIGEQIIIRPGAIAYAVKYAND